MANIPNFGSEPVAVNIFAGGMRQDSDPSYQSGKTYRYSINGRIFYNEDGDAAWMNEKGNKFLFRLSDSQAHYGVTGYVPVGFCELPTGTIIFSTNGINSEIGFIRLVSDAKFIGYQALYNDLYDPNGDKLNLSADYKIKNAIPSIESRNIERVYWTDGHNEPGVFNRMIGMSSVSPEFTSGDYTPIGGYAPGNKYPWFYSAHSMSQQPDFSLGKIKFVRQLGDTLNNGGALRTGIVRMAYRLITRDGYYTLWSPLTRYYFITSDGLNFSYTNYHTRSMSPSSMNTNIGMRFMVENIDSRYYQIEMAYVYSIDKDVSAEAVAFYKGLITAGSSTHTIDFTNMSGLQIPLSDFSKTIIPVKSCQTLEQKGNMLWEGNINTYGDYVIDTNEIEITASVRDMSCDDSGAIRDLLPSGLTRVNAVTTDTPVKIVSYIDKNNLPVYDEYNIVNDWQNYKGVQWTHLFSSYWRGESYPFSVVIFDLKGNPFYAQHIEDFTFPNQYDNGESYALFDNTKPSGTIQMMGAVFSKLRIPLDKVYEGGVTTGKLLISGFAIMRSKRMKRTLCQGVILNTVCVQKNDNTVDGNTYPLPFTSNAFSEVEFLSQTQDSNFYDATFVPADKLDRFGNRAYTFTFDSPDLLFGRNIWEGTGHDKIIESNDRLKLIEVYSCGYNLLCIDNPEDCHFSDPDPDKFNCPQNIIELSGHHRDYYTKNYITLLNSMSDLPYPKGSESRIRLLAITAGVFSNDYTWSILTPLDTVTSSNNIHYYMDVGMNFDKFDCYDDDDYYATQNINGWIVQGKDFKNLSAATNAYLPSYYVANYMINSGSYSSDNGVVNKRLYFTTGHFQPITKSILNTVPVVTISGKDYYEFNGIEVWGGDCYPFVFDYLRLYPKYKKCEAMDYSVGMIIPLESDMNYALRTGRTLASSGIRAEYEACNGGTNFPDGIAVPQPEEFNLNSVLLFEEDANLYTELQPDINPYTVDFPYRWIYSDKKISGEINDAYRWFLPLNFGDVQGQYGEITGCAKLFDSIYSIQQTGFGRLRILDRVAIPVSMGDAIQTGIGKNYDGVDMINTANGTNFAYSISVSDNAFVFVDTTLNCIVRFAGNGANRITNIYDMKDWGLVPVGNFDTDTIIYDYNNPSGSIYEHIHSQYDAVRKEFRFTFMALNSEHMTNIMQTIVFSNHERMTGFTSFQPDIVLQYITCNGYLIAQMVDNADDQYIYYEGNRGEWFGVKHNSEITIVVNEHFDFNKIFDNIMMNINEDGANQLIRVEFTSSEGQSQAIDFATFSKARYRSGFYLFPSREPLHDERLSGHYLFVKFIFTNDNNKVVKFVSNKTILRYFENLQ